jgi:hypothetical protein
MDVRCQFTQAAGDTWRLFHKQPHELKDRGISEVGGERLALSWVLALRRVFASEPVVEEVRSGKPEASYFVVHLPLRGDEGKIVLAAGFAIDPSHWAESAGGPDARALSHYPESRPRTSPAQFLHDEVAQSLSAAGLQLDMLRLDLEAGAPNPGVCTAEIQRLLVHALLRMREFLARSSP